MRGEEIFQPIPERAPLKQVGVVVGAGEKGKNPFNIDLKIPLIHLPFPSSNPKILKAFTKINTLPTKMKTTKCTTDDKK